MAQQNVPPKEVRVLTRLTPRVGDILFYDRKEAGKYRSGEVLLPANGTAHPLTSKWPHHKLCAILEDGEEGWLRFYYAAERSFQHLYNWELDRGEGAALPRCRQTWVIPRATTLGEGNAPAVLTLTAAELTALHEDGSYLTVSTTDEGSPVVWVELDDAGNGADIVGPPAVPLVDDHFDAAGLVALLVAGGIDAEVNGGGDVVITTERLGPEAVVEVNLFSYDAEGVAYSHEINRVVTGAVVSAFDPADLAPPPLPGTWTQTGNRYERIGDERLDGLFVVVVCDWEILSDTLVGYELDELTGELLPVTRQKMTKAAAIAAKQAPDASGIYKEVEPINSRFSWLVTRKATALAGTTQNWDEVQEGVPGHIFPNVLQALSWGTVQRYVESGGEDTYIERIIFIPTMKNAWRGPVKVTVTRAWSHTPFEITLPAQPRPEPILWDALLDTLSLPPCIHANLGTITATISTEDPWRPEQSSSITIGASPDHTDWPETLVFSNRQQQYRGGYLKTTLTAHKPY
jgi:hypothetical protein